MTTATPGGLAHEGDLIHVRVSGTTMFGVTWTRGQEHVLTAENIAQSLNRFNESYIDRELAKGIDGKIALGAWPESEPLFHPGSVEHSLARTRAREQAMGAAPRDREAELRRVREEFGTVPTSTTLSGPTDPVLAQAAYEERQRAKRAVAEERARNTQRVDLDAERERDHFMDLDRAASFNRSLERQDALADDAAIRERAVRESRGA